MTIDSLISLSASVERLVVVAVSTLVVALGALAASRGHGRPGPGLDRPIPRRTELGLLALILAFGTTVRVAWWDDQVTPIFWFSVVPQLFIQKMLDAGAFWAAWAKTLRTYQAGWSHESAVVLPVFVLLQRIVGPAFGLPVLVGAVFGVGSIVLAWLFGQAVRSQGFGLLFAAFVASSPLQISWSRIGGFFIAATPHVLLALFCGYVAGRRRSIVLTLLAGLVAWTTLYHYYAARVAIPLAGAALLRGAQDARASWRCRLALVALFVATLAGVFYGVERGGLWAAVWPSYAGYLGNRGEQSLADVVTRNAESVRENTREALARYFLRTRTTSASDGRWHFGFQHGGLCLAPLGVLGGIGLLVSVGRPRRRWLWLVMLALGVAIPALSFPTARRFQVMDLAWCALAADGLFALASVLGRGLPRRVTVVLVGIVASTIALWSAAVVLSLGAALPRGARQPIPFGESGFGDGLACKGCVAAAKEWQRQIADGAFVVLFDNDSEREDRTSPGGLPAYGKLAALAAGHPDRFVEAYALMGNWDIEPPSAGVLFDPTRTDFAAVLRARIERAAPARIVWHFERPTAWEAWVVRRLAAAGGEVRVFATALGAPPRGFGIEVVTPAARRDAALDVVSELARGTSAADESTCVRLDSRQVRSVPFPALVVAGRPDAAGPPEWFIGSFHDATMGNVRFPAGFPIAAAVDAGADGGPLVDFIGQNGMRTRIDVASQRREQQPLPFGIRYGLGCATRIDEYWWVLDPTSGRVLSTAPQAGGEWIPPEPWVGIARGPDGQLILASANQEIAVLDPVGRRVVARFPGTVPPSTRTLTDPCALLVAGPGWIATLDGLDWVLNVYDDTGRPLGTRRLDLALQLLGAHVSALGAAGRYLGVAAGPLLRTVELTIDPACAHGAPH